MINELVQNLIAVNRIAEGQNLSFEVTVQRTR